MCSTCITQYVQYIETRALLSWTLDWAQVGKNTQQYISNSSYRDDANDNIWQLLKQNNRTQPWVSVNPQYFPCSPPTMLCWPQNRCLRFAMVVRMRPQNLPVHLLRTNQCTYHDQDNHIAKTKWSTNSCKRQDWCRCCTVCYFHNCCYCCFSILLLRWSTLS